ncbi:MAG: isoprenylcysteine carboxylmethyltransferase family protein [Acidobacteriota bacterium]|nr:isoprenylcysteine carboxylmethyltransferase family protein [Acidobacteriota bacterium]
MKLNIGTLLLILVAALLFARSVSHLPLTPMRVAGLAIAVPSFLLLVIARVQLGRAFSVGAKASTLVSTGLYSRIRNPIYVFGFLLCTGVIIWAGNPWLILFLAVLAPLQIWRSGKEEAILEQTFGEEYLEYKRKTWF